MLARLSLQKWLNAAPLIKKYKIHNIPQSLPSPLPQWPRAGAFQLSTWLLLWGPVSILHQVQDGSSPSARWVFTPKFTVYTVVGLCFRGLVSASPGNGGITSTAAWRPRPALVGGAQGHGCQTSSEHASQQRPHSCGWWVTQHCRSSLHSKTYTPVTKGRGEGKSKWIKGRRGKGQMKKNKSLLQLWGQNYFFIFYEYINFYFNLKFF